MSPRSMWRMPGALALAILISACGDASTAPSATHDELVVIAVADVGAGAAGMVLRLTGDVEGIEPAHPSLDVAWAANDSATATVAVLGPVSEVNELLIVTRRAGASALTVEVVDVTDSDGVLSLSTTARAVVRGST